MGGDEIKQITIADHWHFAVVRVTDGKGLGYIELREPGSGTPVARITYNGPDAPMELATFGAALPRPVVEWLLAKADTALA
jgi:hypothetical protein